MNILFINANLYGHINPTLGFVYRLSQHGHQVDYFCSEMFQKEISKAGARWIGYDEEITVFLQNYKSTQRHPFYMLMEYMLAYDEAVLPKLLLLLKNKEYDMVICDSYFGAACYLKQLTAIPVVCSHSSFAMSKAPVPERMLVPGYHPQLDHCHEINHRICEKYQIKEPSLEEIFISRGERNIVYTTKSFNGDSMICEPEYLFFGPSVDRLLETEELSYPIKANQSLVYISLGSVNTDFMGFYRMCLDAFAQSDYLVYMAIGKKCDMEKLGSIPDNFVVKEFLPQLQLLKCADIFITHAGFNSVSEALYFGVPMLTLPLVNDQHMVAKRVETMQLGMTENMQMLTEEILRTKVRELLQNDMIKNNCQKMSVEMQNASKSEQIIQSLEEWKVRRSGCPK